MTDEAYLEEPVPFSEKIICYDIGTYINPERFFLPPLNEKYLGIANAMCAQLDVELELGGILSERPKDTPPDSTTDIH